MLDKVFNKRGFITASTVVCTGLILIAVLVPRIGTINNKSKEAGLRTNMLMVEGIILSVIDDYEATPEGISLLEKRIQAEINSLRKDQDIINPVTGNTGCDILDNINACAVTYDLNDNADNGEGIDAIWTSILDNSAGCVAYCAYIDTAYEPNRISVKLIPYGVNNARITALEKVIIQ